MLALSDPSGRRLILCEYDPGGTQWVWLRDTLLLGWRIDPENQTAAVPVTFDLLPPQIAGPLDSPNWVYLTDDGIAFTRNWRGMFAELFTYLAHNHDVERKVYAEFTAIALHHAWLGWCTTNNTSWLKEPPERLGGASLEDAPPMMPSRRHR